jgi:hypothetical protein
MISGWKEEIQQDYLSFLRGHPKVTPAELAAHLNLSESWVIYWLTDLAREGKVRITGVELVEKDSLDFSIGAGQNTTRPDPKFQLCPAAQPRVDSGRILRDPGCS